MMWAVGSKKNYSLTAEERAQEKAIATHTANEARRRRSSHNTAARDTAVSKLSWFSTLTAVRLDPARYTDNPSGDASAAPLYLVAKVVYNSQTRISEMTHTGDMGHVQKDCRVVRVAALPDGKEGVGRFLRDLQMPNLMPKLLKILNDRIPDDASDSEAEDDPNSFNAAVHADPPPESVTKEKKFLQYEFTTSLKEHFRRYNDVYGEQAIEDVSINGLFARRHRRASSVLHRRRSSVHTAAALEAVAAGLPAPERPPPQEAKTKKRWKVWR